MLGHISSAVQFVARIQKSLVVKLTDQLIELRFAQALFIQIARRDADR